MIFLSVSVLALLLVMTAGSHKKTEESHVSNVIDLLLNLAYFVYFGSIIPWAQYNRPEWGLEPWRLVCIAILVIFFRRIPVMVMLKPFIPDIKTWREAFFCRPFWTNRR